MYACVMTMLPMACCSKIDEACRFLEGMGLRFCVDFGLDNAVQIADWRYPEWDGIAEPYGAD